jgi:histidine ammonia-lyase
LELQQTTYFLDQEPLTTVKLWSLARDAKLQLDITLSTRQRIQEFRKYIESAIDSGEKVYGVTTGFGFLSNVAIPKDKIDQLQVNLIRSHAAGVGDLSPPEVVRAMMILKVVSFLSGNSGVRVEVVDALLSLLNHDILPLVPGQGSVGASGDLAPLAHMALALMGEGRVHYSGQVSSAKHVLENAQISPLRLHAKEGLSLINGTQFMAAGATFALEEAKILARSATAIAALSLDGFKGSLKAFDPRIHVLRPQQGQGRVAAEMLSLFAGGDEILASHEDCDRVQDPYSFRCIPQVHGASWDAIDYVDAIMNREMNATTDNPLVFAGGEVLSGGNFHGQPIAMAMDFLSIAVSELGSISERRIEKLTNPAMSELPAFLVRESGLNSGFMIPHVAAAALASENKVLSHPAVVDSIPTSADKEDHVSMGPLATWKARRVVRNVSRIFAIEALAACQALDLLQPLKPAPQLQKLYTEIRGLSLTMDVDRALSDDIEIVALWILDGGLLRALAERIDQ